MADYSIAAVTRRAVFTGSAGTGPYAFTFACLATSDIAVFKDATKLTETSDYTVSLSATTGTGSVTLDVAANSGHTITLVGARALARTTDFVTAGSLTASALNTDFDSLVIFAQQLSEENSRNLKAPVTEGISGSTDMTIPPKATRASKILEFDSSGNPAVSITATSLSTIAGITGNITTVAGIAANVTTVAGVSANVTTVAGKATEVAAVAAKASLITSDFVSDLNTLATSAIVTDLDILANADIVADLALLATSDVVSDLNTLATSDIVTDINVLATSDIVSDLNTLATSDIVSDLNTLATSAIVTDLSILATSDIVSDINVLATSDIVSDLNTLATSDFVSDLNTLASSTVVTNIATVAANVAGVNSFAARYRVAGSDPGSDNDAGDLVFNTGSNILKVFNGSSFEDVTGTTLAGLNDVNVTSPADGSLLLYDTATSKYIDNVISGDATLADTGVLTLTANSVDSDQYVDGSIDTIHIADAQITTAKVTDDAITSAKLADNLTPSRPNSLPIIINGNMAIAQRAHGSVTGLGDGDEGYVTVDRIRHTHDGTTAGRYTSTQEQINDIPGFAESLNIRCTTADTSIAAGEGFNLEYKFEGHDLHHLQTGHSTARPFTIAFYAKADAAVTYSVEFKNTDHNRHCTRAFTTTTGWTRHVLAFPADTASKYNNDNQHSASLRFWLHAGSNFTSGTAANVFQGVTTANTVAGNGSIFANTSRFISITGIQMEIGSFTAATIPDFQYEGYGENLQRCKRYCQSTFNQHEDIGAASAVGNIITCAAGTAVGRVATGHQFPVSMRVSPTIVIRNQTGGTTGSGRNGDTGGLITMSAGNASTDAAHFENSATFGNDGAQLQFQFSATAEL